MIGISPNEFVGPTAWRVVDLDEHALHRLVEVERVHGRVERSRVSTSPGASVRGTSGATRPPWPITVGAGNVAPLPTTVTVGLPSSVVDRFGRGATRPEFTDRTADEHAVRDRDGRLRTREDEQALARRDVVVGLRVLEPETVRADRRDDAGHRGDLLPDERRAVRRALDVVDEGGRRRRVAATTARSFAGRVLRCRRTGGEVGGVVVGVGGAITGANIRRRVGQARCGRGLEVVRRAVADEVAHARGARARRPT